MNASSDKYNYMVRRAEAGIAGGNVIIKAINDGAPLYDIGDDTFSYELEPLHKLTLDETTIIIASSTRCRIVSITNGSMYIIEATEKNYLYISHVYFHGDFMVALEYTDTEGNKQCRTEVDVIGKAPWEIYESEIDWTNPASPPMLKGKTAITDAMFAMNVINDIYNPRKYVLSERPAKSRNSQVKAARYDDRERFIIMDHETVIKKYKDKKQLGGTHASPCPHIRRGYEKTLRSDIYKNKRNETINVRPTWVGQEEWAGKRGLMYKIVRRKGCVGGEA